MSIEKPQQQESPDAMGAFREKVYHLIQAERAHRETAHFEPIIEPKTKEFLDSLNEEDMRWFGFMEKVSAIDVVRLNAGEVDEYTAELEKFRQARDKVKEFPREIWYEFLANKLNIFSFKLQKLQMRRGDSSFYPK